MLFMSWHQDTTCVLQDATGSTVYGDFTAFFRSLINWHQCGENVAILVFHVHFLRKISSPSNSQERKIWGRCIATQHYGCNFWLEFYKYYFYIISTIISDCYCIFFDNALSHQCSSMWMHFLQQWFITPFNSFFE